MIVSLLKVFNARGASLVEEIRANLSSTGTSKTGKTSQSLHYTVTEDDTKTKFSLLGKPFIYVVETGRKPTPNKKPSRGMIDNIRECVKSIGKPESMVWAVATNINKEGTHLYRMGGRKDIISNVINNSLIESIAKECLTLFATNYLDIVAKMYGSNNR